MNNLINVKTALRNKYAWPGGYPLFLLMDDGAAVSIDAARAHWRDIVAAHLKGHNRKSGFGVAAVAINWEDANLYCDISGERIESAYADEDYGV